MERSRPVRAITHAILAWNTRKNWCKQYGGLSYETFWHSANISSRLLSPEEEEALFMIYLEEKFVFFFGYLFLFSAQIDENTGLLCTDGSPLSLWSLQEQFPGDIQNIWASY